MLVKSKEQYQSEITRLNRELSLAFKELKRRKKMEPKDVQRLKKRIKKLLETLTDLKYRATY